MKIAVVGAGAMGGLFGALLAEADQDLLLLDIRQDHVDMINQEGVSIELEGRVRNIKIRAATQPDPEQRANLVIIFVKSSQTGEAAKTAIQLAGKEGLILTLQNGMGNADILSRAMDPGRVVAGTTSHGATLLGPGKIRHAGRGPTIIGMWSGKPHNRLEEVGLIFKKAGIEVEIVSDVRPVVWGKLLINVGINAITALCNIKNGELPDLSVTRELARAAVEEAMTVAGAQGIAVRKDAVEHVFQVAKATAANRSSMGQDVDNKRLTEISAINGFIVREAEKAGIKVPVNSTLTALVKTLQMYYT